MSVFEKGRAKTGGRAQGVRNKISQAFLEALSKDFDEHGEAAIKIIASILPKELEITENQLVELPDDELDAIVEFTRRSIAARLERAGSREGAEAGGREVELLPPLSKAN